MDETGSIVQTHQFQQIGRFCVSRVSSARRRYKSHVNEFSNHCVDLIFLAGALETKKIDLADKMSIGIDEIAMAKESYRMNYLQKCLQLESEGKFDDSDVCEEMQTILLGGMV